MLTLEVAAEAGDFAGAVIQLRPDGTVQAVEKVGHRERFLVRIEAQFVVLDARECDGVEEPVQDRALQIEHRIVPGIIDSGRVEQPINSAQGGQAFDGEFVKQRRGQLEVVFLEREMAEQLQRFALLVRSHRLVGQPAMRIADVVTVMVDATDEFGGGEQAAIIFT